MRRLMIPLAAAGLLAGCAAPVAPPDMSAGGRGHGPAAETGVTRWEREWQQARRTVATARAEATASGARIPPELDREVTDLLGRRIADDRDDAARIEDLQDAVSDALRLAELLSIG
jgi:regulator of protease activity HflC (stomatin/prohibitin superfamily)